MVQDAVVPDTFDKSVILAGFTVMAMLVFTVITAAAAFTLSIFQTSPNNNCTAETIPKTADENSA